MFEGEAAQYAVQVILNRCFSYLIFFHILSSMQTWSPLDIQVMAIFYIQCHQCTFIWPLEVHAFHQNFASCVVYCFKICIDQHRLIGKTCFHLLQK